MTIIPSKIGAVVLGFVNEFIAAYAATVAAHYSIKYLDTILTEASNKNPEIRQRVISCNSPDSAKKIIEEAVSFVKLNATNGLIYIGNAEMQVNGTFFSDHEEGKIEISNSNIMYKNIIMGGDSDCKGNTTISGNTKLSTCGSRVIVSGGARIIISGGARMIQT